MFNNTRTQKAAVDLASYAILLAGALLMVAPFVWMVSTAFKQPADQFSRNLIPTAPTLENFQNLWATLPFSTLIFNSFKVAALTTIGQLLTCAMAAFVFAVVQFRFRNLLFLLLLLTLMIPFQVTIIPNFILFRTLGLYGTQAPLWLPAFWGGAFGTFLLRQYFQTIPLDLAEAARVDGASLVQIFWRIYLPLVKPVLAVMILFYAVAHWNSFFPALIYLRDRQLYPLQLILREILIQNSTQSMTTSAASGDMQMISETIKYATIVVATVPILLIYPFLQRYFVKGVLIGGIKG